MAKISQRRIHDRYKNPRQTCESVLEFDYRIQVNKWAFVQPFLQYVIRSNGTGLVSNATVLGLHFGIEF